MAKPALGRGLGALLGNVPPPSAPTVAAPTTAFTGAEPRDRVQRIALDRVDPSPLQPRKDFSPETLRELADSIRQQGVVQPLLVRARGDRFELIAGERRWRAAQTVGLTEVPVIVREADDATVLELMLIENLQREDLNPIEEALGYEQLINQFQLRQEDVAAKVGRSRVAVANALRLLRLPPEIQGWLRDGSLSVGHAKAILGLSDAVAQLRAADRVRKDGWNVRQIEEFVAQQQGQDTSTAATRRRGPEAGPARSPHVADLESKLQERFGTRVQVRYRQGKGAVEIRFFNDEDLERILQIVGVKID